MTDTHSDQPRPGWRKKPADHVGHAQATLDEVNRLVPTKATPSGNARKRLAQEYGRMAAGSGH